MQDRTEPQTTAGDRLAETMARVNQDRLDRADDLRDLLILQEMQRPDFTTAARALASLPPSSTTHGLMLAALRLSDSAA